MASCKITIQILTVFSLLNITRNISIYQFITNYLFNSQQLNHLKVPNKTFPKINKHVIINNFFVTFGRSKP